METIDKTLERLHSCESGTDCTGCPMRYEEECEQFLYRVRCAAEDAAAAIEELRARIGQVEL